MLNLEIHFPKSDFALPLPRPDKDLTAASARVETRSAEAVKSLITM